MRSPLLLSIALSAACATGLQAENAPAQKPAESAPAALAQNTAEPKTPAKPGRSKPSDPQPPAAAEPSKPIATAPAPATPRPAASSKASPTPAAATPAPEASTPAPKKPGFFQRLFGRGKKAAATPTPATPAPTPTPATPRPRKPRKPAETPAEGAQPETTPESKPEAKSETAPAAPTEKPAESEKPAAPAENAPATPSEPAPAAPETKMEKPEKAATPAPSTPAAKKGRGKTGAAKPTPAAAEQTKEQIELQKAIAGGNPDEIETAKFNEVKSRASKDPHVQELKQKADNASDAESTRALRAYNKALYQKMRNLSDGSIRDRIDRMEEAVLKRLSQPAGGE